METYIYMAKENTVKEVTRRSLTDPSLLHKLFEYDPITGILTNKVQRHYSAPIGAEVGNVETLGYRVTTLNGTHKKIHHIIVAMQLGYWPKEVDHINHNRTDNTWDNLRVITRRENMLNKSAYKNNKSGVPGVAPYKTDRFVSTIRKDHKDYHLGIFDNFLDAVCARKSAEVTLGFHPNHGDV